MGKPSSRTERGKHPVLPGSAGCGLGPQVFERGTRQVIGEAGGTHSLLCDTQPPHTQAVCRQPLSFACDVTSAIENNDADTLFGTGFGIFDSVDKQLCLPKKFKPTS